MSYLRLINDISSIDLTDKDGIFKLVRSVGNFYQNPVTEAVDGRDLIIRLVDRRSDLENSLKGIGKMIDAIAREAGLHPYMTEPSNWRDEIALNMMRAPGSKHITFHIEQAEVFWKLVNGKSIILSAPTSFGKSLLVGALIEQTKPDTVVAVVPTLALLDEYRRRLLSTFENYQIITTASEVRTKKKAIYVGTQERLLQRIDIEFVDLFVIDEFYKLDLDRHDQRSLALNAILSRYGRDSKQIYFLGPSIDDVPNAEKFRPDIEFIKTRFSPVAADIIDRTDGQPTPERLIEDLRTVIDESSLVYVRSPRSAYLLIYDLIEAKLQSGSDFCQALGDWLSANFHPEWILCDAVKSGLGIHHGRIPRSIAQLLISLFNTKELKTIVCTSSMIEGINTAAQNVFIYDRHISTHKLDRFTFDNIKGRAGRMFQHKVGKIFLYNQPPEALPFDVRVPLFENQDRLVPELLVQIDDDALTASAKTRKRSIVDASVLPVEVLRQWAEYGIDELNRLASELRELISDDNSLLIWTGYPRFENVNAVFDVVWNRLKFNKHDVRSARQAAYFAGILRRETTIRRYMDCLVRGTGSAAQLDIDRCFNFLRGAEHTFPQIFRAVNDIIDYIAKPDLVDFRLYAQQLQNYFIPNEGRYLDEFGVPVPILAKLTIPHIQGSREIIEALSDPNSPYRSRLTSFEQQLLNRGLAFA